MDPENYYRKRLSLYSPCRNAKHLKGNSAAYVEQYNKSKRMIESMAKKYEHNVDELQRAIDRAAEEDLNYDEVSPGT